MSQKLQLVQNVVAHVLVVANHPYPTGLSPSPDKLPCPVQGFDAYLYSPMWFEIWEFEALAVTRRRAFSVAIQCLYSSWEIPSPRMPN